MQFESARATSSTIFCLFAMLLVHMELTGATAGLQSSYLIRARQIEDVPEALAILRRFIPHGPNKGRCSRYAVLLDSLTSSHVDQFSIAELGLASYDSVWQKFRRIDIETLRQLYIDAINKFRGDHFDQSMLELMDCLSTKFRTVDAKARSFLNSKELQELVGQYKSIMDQPLDFLLDPNYKHPTLTRNQVNPQIKQTLLNLFNGDSTEVESHFNPAPTDGQSQVTVVATGSAAPAQAVSTAFTAPDLPGKQVDTAAESVPQNDFVESNLDQADDDDLGLTSDEQEYLNDFVNSIHLLYNTLPLASQLNDRCEAYAKLTKADPKSLKEQTVEDIVQETSGKLTGAGPTEKVFLPDKSVRENFLFSLKAIGRERLGNEIWIDLVDCVSQWDKEDQDVAQFMNSTELAKAYEDISQTIGTAGQTNDELAQGGPLPN